ncbi:hypothetical protein HYS49_03865 [Candidatus Woesearchaeota archaeon]|nr:hypothetical protein [Candidatus Woesearchaeota archaeon]
MIPTLTPYCTQRLPWSVQDSPINDILNDSLTQQLVAVHLQDVVQHAMIALAQLPELEVALIPTFSNGSSAREIDNADLLVFHNPWRSEKRYIITPVDDDVLLRLYPGERPSSGDCQIDDIYDNDKEGVTRITLASGSMYVFHKEAGKLDLLLLKEKPSPLIVPVPFGFYQQWRREAGLPVRE